MTHPGFGALSSEGENQHAGDRGGAEAEEAITIRERGIDFRSNKEIPVVSPRTETPLSDEHVIDIPPSVAGAIGDELEKITTSPYDDFDAFFAAAISVFTQHLPRELGARIEGIERNTDGLLLIRGLPLDSRLPRTPSAGGSLPPSAKSTFVAEGCLAGVASLLPAEPFNYRQEAFATAPLIDNVVPLADRPYQQGAGGFRDNFPFHTESAWHRLTPELVVLNGIRGDEGCLTVACTVSDALSRLDAQTRATLASERFVLRAPQLYHQMEESGIPLGTAAEARVPITVRDDARGWWTTRVNCNGTTCLDRDAFDAMCAFEDALYAAARRLVLRAGTMIVMDNRRVVHTRTGYEPAFDGQDRWFQRMNMSNRLWQPRPVTDAELASLGVTVNELRVQGLLDDEGEVTARLHELEARLRSDSREELPVSRDLLERLLLHTPATGHRIV